MKNAFRLFIAFTLASSSTWASYGNTEVTSLTDESSSAQNETKLCIDSLDDYSAPNVQDCVASMKTQALEEHADTKFLHGYCISTLTQKGMSRYQAESTCAYLL